MEISERIRYVDQLRAVSILFLIAINVAMVFKYKSVGNLQEYVVFTTFGFGVPIFLMLLGLLMIDRDYSDIETFIKTDFVRIFIPFLIWNTLLALLMTASAGKLSFSFSFDIQFPGYFLQFTGLGVGSSNINPYSGGHVAAEMAFAREGSPIGVAVSVQCVSSHFGSGGHGEWYDGSECIG